MTDRKEKIARASDHLQKEQRLSNHKRGMLDYINSDANNREVAVKWNIMRFCGVPSDEAHRRLGLL